VDVELPVNGAEVQVHGVPEEVELPGDCLLDEALHEQAQGFFLVE
jgi:hypothetical protein